MLCEDAHGHGHGKRTKKNVCAGRLATLADYTCIVVWHLTLPVVS